MAVRTDCVTFEVDHAPDTMSALADKNTKGVADGIENTMGRGLEVFGFFMTSLGLNGVVRFQLLSMILPVRRIVVRKIGDILRKAVKKAVDAVVRVVREKFKGLFLRRGAGTQEGNQHGNVAKVVIPFSMDGEGHKLTIPLSGNGVVTMASENPSPLEEELQFAIGTLKRKEGDDANLRDRRKALEAILPKAQLLAIAAKKFQLEENPTEHKKERAKVIKAGVEVVKLLNKYSKDFGQHGLSDVQDILDKSKMLEQSSWHWRNLLSMALRRKGLKQSES